MSYGSKCIKYAAFLFLSFFFSAAHAEISFDDAFARHNAVMLLINPEDGRIVEANKAASEFYGYSQDQLRNMTIQQINTLTPEQVALERVLAKKEGRNFFIFRHQVAAGDVRTVEVHSVPVSHNQKTLLFSVITDISDVRSRDQGLWHYQERLEEMVAIQTAELKSKSQLIILIMGGSIILLIVLLILLIIVARKSIASKQIAEEQQATLDTIFNNITDAIIYTDRNRNIVTANKSAREIFGYDNSALLGASARILYADPKDYKEQGLFRFSPDAEPRTDLYEITYKRQDSSHFVGETLGSVIKNPAGQALGYIGVIRDITKRKTAEEDLRQAASVFRNASEGIIITSPNGTILDVNQAFTTITGYDREDAVGSKTKLLKSGYQNEAFYQAMWNRLLEFGHWEGEIHNRHKDGRTYIEQLSINAVKDQKGEVQRYIGLFYDITNQKEHERQLHHIAHFDALTDLPNRLLLADRLQQGMLQADRQNHVLAVVYIDLDGFKEINDQYGHDVGDKLLIEIARRMKNILREGDTVARLGGDEFVAVFTDLHDTASCIPLLERILKSIATGVRIADNLHYVSASLGVAFFPSDESEPDKLLRQADQAMYRAKLQGKNCYHIYDPVYDRSLIGRREKLERLQRALEDQEFELFYQPKVNMVTGELTGVEALIRWNHPEKGLLVPADFLTDIEDHDMGIDLGNWVIRTALEQLAIWQEMGLMMQLSVNISAQQLQEEQFPQQLQALLSEYPAVNPDHLELEILESSALQDLMQVSENMRTCSTFGVRFALDDFGTGYSSLTYLKSLPVEVLKIDRTFVNGMLKSNDDMSIIKGVLGLAKAFQRDVVAEGVETIDQGKALIKLGCYVGQGFYIARPMPAADIETWHKSWERPEAWLEMID